MKLPFKNLVFFKRYCYILISIIIVGVFVLIFYHPDKTEGDWHLVSSLKSYTQYVLQRDYRPLPAASYKSGVSIYSPNLKNENYFLRKYRWTFLIEGNYCSIYFFEKSKKLFLDCTEGTGEKIFTSENEAKWELLIDSRFDSFFGFKSRYDSYLYFLTGSFRWCVYKEYLNPDEHNAGVMWFNLYEDFSEKNN